MMTTPKTLRETLERLATMADSSAEDAAIICECLDRMLDDLLSDDFFGTEGQLDPRGDHRNDP